jgi:transcriptional antiterminator
MAATGDTDDKQATDRLTAELCRQLTLHHQEVRLGDLADETGLSAHTVESMMGVYERQHSGVERVSGVEAVTWRLRDEDDE